MSGKAKNTTAGQDTKRGEWHRYDPDKMAEKIRKSRGTVKHAAAVVGCSRVTIRKYMQEFPEVAQAMQEAKDGWNDNIEMVIQNSALEVRRGFVVGPDGKGIETFVPTEQALRAAIFWSKTQMGWSERSQHQVDINAPVKVVVERA